MSEPDVVLWGDGAASLDRWSAAAATGSRARLDVGGGALGFAFGLEDGQSWAIARREIAVALPSHWVVALRLRADGAPTELQVKLIDPAGANVWWWRRRERVSDETQHLVLRRAALEFAWGPAGGGDPDRLGAVEIAVAGGAGSGTLWIEDFRIEPRPPASGPPRPRGIRASSYAAGHEPERVLAAGERTGWRPDATDATPWIELDLGETREWGGLVVDFTGTAPPSRVLAAAASADWAELARDPGGPAGRRWLRTGEAESRRVRLELAAADGWTIARVAVVPIELTVSPARWAAGVARAAPRGWYPRHLLGEQAYWAVVGGDGAERKGLLSEDGALEVDAEAFTVEPFLATGGRVLTWADVETSVALADDSLPIPSVAWAGDGLRLRVTACASGESMLVARYAVENPGDAARAARLLLAIRPFQVTPAWQSLNLRGGVASIVRIERDGPCVRVNDDREVVAVTAPDAFGASRSDEGPGSVFEGRLSASARVDDPLGFAEGVLAFDLVLPPSGSEEIVIAVPLSADAPRPPAGIARAAAAEWGATRLADATAHWRARLANLPIALPPSGARVATALRASLAWILVNREGPRIQPGPRAYRRSWIRDGTLTGTALAEMGFADEARAFLRWYAPHQYDDGRVPCAVDRRGVDPAVEHDSHGELVWGVVEVFRLTGDRAFLGELWPRVLRAVDAIARLRATRTTDAFRDTACFGLLPESISHEGYASRPVHAYWDDFFALRALADTADAATVLGDVATAARIGGLRDAMRGDLHASIAATIARHGIDFLPGSVELGDFDPTSSAIVFDPCGEAERLPRALLEHTFERYWVELAGRQHAAGAAAAYTPYEIRNVVAMLRLGWKERALALLDRMLDDQRPREWRQWPEIVWRDARAPRFLGDLPHGWVASTFVRAVRRLIAYERDHDDALVVGAGVPEVWVREEPGVRIHGLATHFGALDLTMRAESDDRVRVVFGTALGRPPGGIVLESPLPRPLREVIVDGRAHPSPDPRRAHLHEVPREVVLVHGEGEALQIPFS
jgi:hypothetical protein